MDQKIRDFLIKEWKVGTHEIAFLDVLLVVGMTIAGIMLRVSVYSYESITTESYKQIADGIKATSVFFDIAIAVLVYLFVMMFTKSKVRAMVAYGVTVALPVLVAGSAMWGLGDSVYAFFAIVSIYLTLKNKGTLGLAFFGLALFLNQNTLFLLPVMILFFFWEKNRLYGFLYVFAGYISRVYLLKSGFASKFPLFRVNEQMADTNVETLLSYRFPNCFQIIGVDKFVAEYSMVATWIVVAICFMILAFLIQYKPEFTDKKWMVLSLFFVMFIPYFAPFMNERSGLLADIIALIVGFIILERFYIPIVQVIVSYIAYSNYFRGESVIPLSYISFVVLALLFLIVVTFFDKKVQWQNR